MRATRIGWAMGLLLAASGCTGSDQAVPLPGAGTASGPSGPATPTGSAVSTPAPDDAHAAVPDADATRTVSPAQGTVSLAVRGSRPGGDAGAVHDAYVGWVRGYLTAYARPGASDGGLDRWATPVAAAAVRRRVGELVLRRWAEYGTAELSAVTVRPAGATAQVTACLDLSGLATRDRAGRLARRDRPVRSTAALVRTGDRWLTSADLKTPTGSCP